MDTHANPEEFDLYALGALDGEDRLRFEAHLRTCAACRRQLAEAQELCTLIGMSAPAAMPPPSVKARLMESIHQEKSVAPASKPVRKHANWGLRFSLIFALCTIVLILICSWMWRLNNFRADELSNTIAQLRTTESQAQKNQAAMHAMTQVISAPDTVRVTLAHQTGTPPGTANVYYNARMGVVVYTGVIAPAPSDKSYQLWLVPDTGAPVSAGLVQANQQTGAAVAHLPQGLSAKAFAVTLEPKGGEPQPTGPKVLVGAVGNA